jgi:stage V sporulation protein B
MVGFFTGINKIGTLTAVEVAEQFCSMTVTVLLLNFWSGTSAIKACQAVIIGSGIGACITLIVLVLLKHWQKNNIGPQIHIRRRLLDTAVPLAIADTVKAGISTTENLMVPKRLQLYPGETAPLAAFGMVCGMVFPILMFPAAILFGLAELLIPEIARCNAAGSTVRIRHLTEKSLRLSLLYGCLCSMILFLTADRLCIKLYSEPTAGKYLKCYAILAPMLYCDVIIDAITKG